MSKHIWRQLKSSTDAIGQPRSLHRGWVGLYQWRGELNPFFPSFCPKMSVSGSTSVPQGGAVCSLPPATLSLRHSRPGTKTPWPGDREVAVGTTKLLATCGRQSDTQLWPLAEPNQTSYKSCCKNKLFQKLSIQFRKVLQQCGLPGACICLFVTIHTFFSKFCVCR